LNWLTPGNYEKWKRGSAQVGAPNTRLASEINLAIQENGINHDITVANVMDKIVHIESKLLKRL